MKTKQVTSIENVFIGIPSKEINKQVFFTDNIDLDIEQGSFPPCFGTFYSIAYCKKGFYDIEIDGETYHLKSGSMLIFRPGEYFRFLNAQNYLGYLFSFTEDFLAYKKSLKDYEKKFSFLKRGTLNLFEIETSKQDYFEGYFQGYGRIISNSGQPYRIEIVKNIFRSMLYELEAFSFKSNQLIEKKISSLRKMSILESFKDILEYNFKSHFCVKFYAEKLCITPDYLAKSVRRACGKTAMELINERRLTEAKLLLKSTEQPIYHISESLSFSSSTVFSRFFLNLMGVTPMNYRKLNRHI